MSIRFVHNLILYNLQILGLVFISQPFLELFLIKTSGMDVSESSSFFRSAISWHFWEDFCFHIAYLL